jgi:DNA-binding winged helix-turn-helix (wHTH) protein
MFAANEEYRTSEARLIARTHKFGPFRLNAEVEVLFRGKDPIPLGQRAVEALRVLVERPGELISKDHLMEAAWRGLAVEERQKFAKPFYGFLFPIIHHA